MKKYVIVNTDNTIQCITDTPYGDEYKEVEVDDDFDDMSISHLLYQGGKLVEDEGLKEQEQANKKKAARQQLQKSQMLNLVDEIITPMMVEKTFTATSAAKVSSFAPEWSPDSVSYKPGNIVTDPYDGLLYICNEGQGHTSQAGWDPHAAASLWSLIKIAPDGNREWVTPTGAHNDYAKDEYCWYPDYESGSLYKSKQNGNVWPPNDTPTSTWTLVSVF